MSDLFHIPESNKYNQSGKWSKFFHEEDKFNTTCPSDLFGGFQGDFLSQTVSMGSGFNRRLNSTITDEFGQHDACSLEDDEREALMRMRRKEDSYKTALCESHRRTGTCAYAETCRFAHGVRELRLSTQPRGRAHPKYKTVLCDKFSMTGFCKYGSRCQFIHKIANPALLKKHEEIKNSLIEEDNPLVRFFRESKMEDLNQSMPMVQNQYDEMDQPRRRAPERNGGEGTCIHLELKKLSLWNRSSVGPL